MVLWTENVLQKTDKVILLISQEVFVMDVFLFNACNAGLSARPYLPFKGGAFHV